MRSALDRLYRLSGALAAVFVAAICAVVVLQVGANILDTVLRLLRGAPLGLVVPSYAEFTGFFLVAATFFALAYTLRSGGHIRVSLVIRGLGPRPRRAVEIWCSAAGAALAAYFTWFAFGMAAETYAFGDVSAGIVPVPLWIPQSSMALGLAVLTVALIDELVAVIAGRAPEYAKGDDGEMAGS